MSLRPGKLPSALLAELLGHIVPRDPRVLLGPGIGRDAAVIDIGGGRLLVAKTDPVTFAIEHIGWYAVNVNANDIACMGAQPRWFLATALLPPGAAEAMARGIFDELLAACRELDIELVGGHTEMTIGLDRPIIVGAMLGEATRDEIVLGEGITPGDQVILTKSVAIEGTALLAIESADRLLAAGVDAATVERARGMLFDPGLSVVGAARAITSACRPRLMHDPTEGGIATALYELAAAAGTTLRLHDGAIPVHPETRTICDALGLDPLGLLASGALLAIVPAKDSEAVTRALADAKIMCTALGTVETGPPKVIMGLEASAPTLPSFARDELARFYDRGSEQEGARGTHAEGL